MDRVLINSLFQLLLCATSARTVSEFTENSPRLNFSRKFHHQQEREREERERDLGHWYSKGPWPPLDKCFFFLLNRTNSGQVQTLDKFIPGQVHIFDSTNPG